VTFLFSPSGELLLASGDPPRLPAPTAWCPGEGSAKAELYVGALSTTACFAAWGPDAAPAGTQYRNLREFLLLSGNPLAAVAGRSRQVLEWDRDHRFCGRCSARMRDKGDERARVCPACAHLCFPRISPAIIVGVTRGEALLLCRNRRFVGGMHSLVAGFVEVGETLEQAVEREVAEEVGLQVTQIRYFGSQSWPFPSGLMLAFTAEARPGDIHVDGDEIVEADWYTAADHPPVPGHGSISRQIIDSILGLPR
jgi:NAD+ diphosphatase